MTISNRIRKIREQKKMTQAEVAYKINISPSAYGQIERNALHTKYSTLCKIAEALDVVVSVLVDTSDTN